ncbi:2-hydroxy-3-oxopropionate reductase [Massiliimalia massiliensis]|uniref:2-hydroxy-3-oxopropionate reductase n=1 Tax=Massiliimalia massiliensis TaxID=1852384 RepID=UPI000984F3E3|nr:2-hydroxy-3-oxopropionate reductase [Massiliimalia massiliensis]
MKIGFIGLGIMGKPMVRNLLKSGYTVICNDIQKDAVEEMVCAGAQEAENAAQVTKECDLIITMLPNSPQVKRVVLGEHGIIEEADKGKILVDMSSIDPQVSQEVAAILGEKGMEMIDAPVSGGEPKAIDGTLAIMAGGKEEVFQKVKPVLLCMGQTATLCGDIGAGNTVKLANQIIVALNIAAVSEAFVLGTKAGVDPHIMFEALKNGLAGSTVLNAKAPLIMERNFKPGFKIDLHYKDLNNALEAAKGLSVPLTLTAQVFEILKALRNDGKGNNDHCGIVEYYEKLSNVEVK